MATDNNTFVNSFVTGIDSDSSLDRVKNTSYLEAKNIRVLSFDSTNQHGSIKPINGIKQVGSIKDEKVERILATGAVRDRGVIIYISEKRNKPEFCISCFDNKIGQDSDTDNSVKEIQNISNIFRSELIDWPTDRSKWPKNVSITFKYEGDDNIKLYVATGFNPIMVFNIAKLYSYNNTSFNTVQSYPKIIFQKPKFVKYVDGTLKTSYVSYSYQIYSNHGVSTDISPACQSIPVINVPSDRTDVLGIKTDQFDKKTNCGVQILIKPETDYSFLNRIKIYRISVQINGQLPTIEVIYDSAYEPNRNGDFFVNDTGQQALDTITIEEYNSMSGVHIIPKVIESKDNILFAANIQERSTFIDTDLFKKWDSRSFRANGQGQIVLQNTSGDQKVTYKWSELNELSISNGYIERDSYNPYNDINKQYYLSDSYCIYDKDNFYGGTGVNVSWRFTVTYIPIDTCSTTGSKEIGTMWNVLKVKNTQDRPTLYFVNKNGLQKADIEISTEEGRINNSWVTKSLKRNELYRYGIILYDSTGSPSPVKWIADIRTPNLYDKYFNTFISHYNNMYDLASIPLGVAFNVKNLPEGCTGYEIVRCQRREQDIASIAQGVISKPIVGYSTPECHRPDRTTYFPTGLLTTAMVAQGSEFKYFTQNYNPANDDKKVDAIQAAGRVCASNFGNTQIFQFVSAETAYQPESIKVLTNNKDFKLEPLRYIFGQSGKFQKEKHIGNKYFMSPGISNTNIYTKPDQANDGKSYEWKYYANKSGGGYTEYPYKSSPYILKMLTAHLKTMYYKADVSDKMWTCLSPGKIDENIKYSGSNMNKIDDKVFAYIKLYEQGCSLRTRICGTTDHLIDYGPRSMDEHIDNNTKLADIDDIQIASELKWNEVIKRTFLEKGSNSDVKDNGKWWPTIEYNNHIDSVGKYQFCNAVFYGCDGAVIDRGGIEGDDKTTIAHDMVDGADQGDVIGDDNPEYILRFPFSTGGRCALLSMKNDCANMLFNSIIGAQSYYKNVDNNLQEFNSFSSYYNVNINSIPGTVLCNIRKTVTPYDGCTEKSITASTYRSDGQFFTKANEWNSVFDGDTYISVLDYTSMHKATCNFLKGKDDMASRDYSDYRSPSMMLGYAIPVESNINCRFAYGYEFSKNSTNEGASMIQIEPANVNNMYTQTEPEYLFNTTYAAENNSRIHAAFDTTNIEDFNKNVDYMCRYSMLKEDNEHIDSWTKFQSSNYLDVDSKYGKITGLRTYKQWLVFWQQMATGLLSVNERAITDSTNGTQLILGTGGVLSRYDYLDQTTGMHNDELCDTQSSSTLYWFDHHNQELRSFDGQGVYPLSKGSQAQNILYKYQNKDSNPTLFFDNRNNEVVCKVIGEDSFVYNEAAKAFPSIYTIPFDGAIQFSNKTLLVKNINGDIKIAQWDADNKYTTSWEEKILHTYIKYVVNSIPTATKVFDNQEIITPQDEFQYIDIQNDKKDRDSYFGLSKEYKWSTDSGMKSEDDLHGKITIREHNYRYAIPRDNRANAYGSRMRGKYLVCEMQDNKPNTNVAIQYILTKFRASWI